MFYTNVLVFYMGMVQVLYVYKNRPQKHIQKGLDGTRKYWT